MKEQRKVLVGRVTSNRMDKTVVVEVKQRKRHRLYGKVINVRKRFKAHDEDNACKIGDLVRMIEYRPLSREKRWMVTEILESGAEASEAGPGA
jgi:small subunit ribosomal protein S17